MTRLLLYAGVVGSAVLTAGWLVAGFLQAGADVRRGSISDLGAAEADRAWLWNAPLTLGGALIALFALGLHRALRPSRTASVAASLIALAGLGLGLEGALFRLDCRETELACQVRASTSWRHSAHEIESGIGLLALFAAIVVLALGGRSDSRRRWLGSLSLLTAAVLVVLLVLSGGAEGTDWEGVLQRVLVTVVLTWIAALSAGILRQLRRNAPVAEVAGEVLRT